MASGEQAYVGLSLWLGSGLGKLVIAASVFSFSFHLFGGIRHLIWDAGWMMEMPQVRVSGWLAIIGSVLLSLIVLGAGYEYAKSVGPGARPGQFRWGYSALAFTALFSADSSLLSAAWVLWMGVSLAGADYLTASAVMSSPINAGMAILVGRCRFLSYAARFTGRD